MLTHASCVVVYVYTYSIKKLQIKREWDLSPLVSYPFPLLSLWPKLDQQTSHHVSRSLSFSLSEGLLYLIGNKNIHQRIQNRFHLLIWLLIWASMFSSNPVELNVVPGIYVKHRLEKHCGTLRLRRRHKHRRRDSERLDVGPGPCTVCWVCFPLQSVPPSLHLSTAYSDTDRASEYVCTCASLPCQIFSQTSGSEL